MPSEGLDEAPEALFWLHVINQYQKVREDGIICRRYSELAKRDLAILPERWAGAPGQSTGRPSSRGSAEV
jgi:hypothetical protein